MDNLDSRSDACLSLLLLGWHARADDVQNPRYITEDRSHVFHCKAQDSSGAVPISR